MKEVEHDKGLYTEEEFDAVLSETKERQAEASVLSDEDAKQITAITLMRIYDMLGAILTHLDEDAAEAILAKHANGELVGPLPSLNL